MIKYSWYRRIRVYFGSRSFVNKSISKGNTYILIKGLGRYERPMDNMIKNLIDNDYEEEWAR